MRIIPPSEQRQYSGPSGARIPRLSRKELQHQMARQAAIERSKARYLKLVCEHYSTLERDEMVSHWRPKAGLTWCDQCSDWVRIKPPYVPPNLGDTPMF